MWIIVALISVMFYATAEVIQKKGSNEDENFASLKLLIWFGIFSGITSMAVYFFGFKETNITATEMLKTKPISILSPLFYYISLLFCFLSFKFIPLSIASPITCIDGILTFVGVIVMFLFVGEKALIDESITPLKLLLVVLVLVGIYACGIIQNKFDKGNALKIRSTSKIKNTCFAFLGIILAFISATFDASSSLTDIYLLSDEFASFDYIYLHGILVFAFTIPVYIILLIKNKKLYNPFSKTEISKMLGAGFDNIGMIFYMIAVSKNAIYTNVLISSFCVCTVILSKILLKEKTNKKLDVWIFFTIVCIIAFAIVDEMF